MGGINALGKRPLGRPRRREVLRVEGELNWLRLLSGTLNLQVLV
jgi:hypothetical protein